MAKKKKASLEKVGHYAFFIGAILAIVLGLFLDVIPIDYRTYLVTLLVFLGLVVGILNITIKEATPFLVASITLIIALVLAGIVDLGPILRNILKNIVRFVVPAAVIVSLRAILRLAGEK